MKTPATHYHGDRPCLHPSAYPVLWRLAAARKNETTTKLSLWQRIKKALSK